LLTHILKLMVSHSARCSVLCSEKQRLVRIGNCHVTTCPWACVAVRAPVGWSLRATPVGVGRGFCLVTALLLFPQMKSCTRTLSRSAPLTSRSS
jgi:hypothetical protein